MTAFASAPVLAALVVLLFAAPSLAQSVDVPVGRTLTIDLGAPIRSMQIQGGDRIQVRTLSQRVVAVTALRGGPVRMNVRTADGMQRVDLQVRAPQKEALSSRELERFLEENPLPERSRHTRLQRTR